MRVLFPLLILLVAMGAACAEPPERSEAPEPASEPGEWIVLFDGHGFEHWRGFRQDSMPDAWAIISGAMYNANPGHDADLVTREQFSDFELEFEWKVEEGGNSGVMYRVTEDRDYPWATGPEYQLLDNEGHADADQGLDRMAGANYDVHPTDSTAARPAGEWNTGRILVDGNHVEHWLNGTKVVEYELLSPEWRSAVAASKWANNPDYGRRPEGHIALQGDHEPVWFRTMRIRRL